MPALKHGITVRASLARCLTTKDGARILKCYKPWMFLKLKLAKSFVHLQTTQSASRNPSPIQCTTTYVKEDIEHAHDRVSLALCSPFFEQGGFRNKAGITGRCRQFTFESFHKFSLGILKILRKCLLIQISSPLAVRGNGITMFRALNHS